MENLSIRLGYKFKNIRLLAQALCHRSAASKHSNERLEFLGDAVLNFIITVELYDRYPRLNEGELSRLRSNLVNGVVLAKLAREFEVGGCLQLGAGELKSGGFQRDSILADAMEAIIGAMYLDSGIIDCRTPIVCWYEDRLNTVCLGEAKDPKTSLQELMQARKSELPCYEIASIDGVSHDQVFHIKCTVAGISVVTVGTGSSKRKAEQDAAEKFLQALVDNKV